MKLKILIFTLILTSLAQASLEEIATRLSSSDLGVQTQARNELLAVCSEASRPGAEAERKEISLEMCRMLSKKAPLEVMRPLIGNLQRMGGEEAVETLEKLLNHPNEHVRDDARRALSANPSPEAAKVLGSRLKMRSARSSRETAGLIYALGERKQEGASNLISGYLADRNDEVFMAVVKSLGRLNEDTGVEAMMSRRSMEKGVRLMQLEAALFSTGRSDVFKQLYAENEPDQIRATALLGLLMNHEPDLAAGALASGDEWLQAAVIEAATQLSDQALYSLLANHLEELSPVLQVQAMAALVFSGSREYATFVEPFLSSPDAALKDAAAQTLAKIGTAQSVLPLLGCGTAEARKALSLLSAEGVDGILEEQAANATDNNVRVVAIDVLAVRARNDLIPQFFSYAEGTDETVAVGGVSAIGRMGNITNLKQLTELMIEKEATPLSRNILEAIVQIMRRSTEPARAVEILLSCMPDASPRSQANILQALAQTGSDEALAPLVDACRSGDAALSKLAVKLLAGWRNENGLPAMIELASDESFSLANHVALMRGISRLLAGQENIDPALAEKAMNACRRDEERQIIADLLGSK